MKSLGNANRWRVRLRDTNDSWEGTLVAYWEVEGDPISDDYTPDEITARELLDRWAKRCSKRHEDGLVPIHWFVQSTDAAKFELMPFAYDHFRGRSSPKNFLDYFTWPEDVASGEPLNWLSLVVVDKLWNGQRADKGGFIQQATSWKPSILQPFVYLPSLLRGIR